LQAETTAAQQVSAAHSLTAHTMGTMELSAVVPLVLVLVLVLVLSVCLKATLLP
jgi:hypothetical protein